MFSDFRSFPFYRQRDVMQCGAACLWMICRHFGVYVGMNRIEELCPHSKVGVSMLSIRQAAQTLGIEAEAVRVSFCDLRNAPLPAILHWEQKHFVILHKISKDGQRFHIADPGRGKYHLNEHELANKWCYVDTSEQDPVHRRGIAMLFRPEKETCGRVQTEKNHSNLGAFLRYIKRELLYHKGLWIQMLAGMLFGTLLDLIIPFLLRDIVDVGIRHSHLGLIILILLGELVIVCGKTAAAFIRRWIVMHVSLRLNLALVSDFFARLLRLPMRFFETRQLGDMTQRVSDHYRIQSFLTQEAPAVLFSLFSFFVLSGVLWWMSGTVLLVFMGLTLLHCLWVVLYLNRRKILDMELFELQSSNQTLVYDMLRSVQEIKLQDCEMRKRREWERQQLKFYTLQQKSLRLLQTQQTGTMFLSEFRNLSVTVLAAAGVIDGSLTLGDMMALQFIVGQLGSPVNQVIAAINSLQDILLSVDRIADIRNRRPEDAEIESDYHVTRHDENRRLVDGGQNNGISLRNVTFRYNRYDRDAALSEISLDIPKGSVTAVVGASGCGKTTLIKLLLGYYTPEKGEIIIEGRELSRMGKREWRRRCGSVMQTGIIFPETIRRNIACDDSDPDEGRIEEAVRVASLEEMLAALPMGLDTRIGTEGHGLSQGQQQRILLARAVYRNPDYIFLDEATNSLDTRTEAEITNRLNSVYRGKTVIIAAHRLYTVMMADQIVVLEGGRIIECGSHEELLAHHGQYFSLVRNQLDQ